MGSLSGGDGGCNTGRDRFEEQWMSVDKLWVEEWVGKSRKNKEMPLWKGVDKSSCPVAGGDEAVGS